jgi:uncharacterized membrane protein YtjA (UPF0391 family)
VAAFPRGIAARAAGAAKAVFVVELFALSLLCAASLPSW